MNSLISTIATGATLAYLLPAASAHMAMWHPSVYGFQRSYEPVTPLANKPFNEWWFHGYANERPNEVMSLRPGQDVQVEIACSKSYTSWGNSKRGNDACPGDAGSYHAGGSTGSNSGWNGNSEENLTGCALAIAYKSDAKDVRPEDFIVMSVQENCVRWRDTSFSIPANLPACPNGECTCAWFWQGKNSAAEMYMNGFRCNVVGGSGSGTGIRPAEPRRGGTISGPTQPMYWANSPTNIGYNPDYGNRPTYNSRFGWQNGAQTSAFSGAGGGNNNNGGNNGGNNNAASSSSSSTSSSSRTRRPQSSAATSTIGNQYLADPSASSSESVSESAEPTPSVNNASPTAAPTTGGGGGGGKGKGKHCKRRRSRAHVNLS